MLGSRVMAPRSSAAPRRSRTRNRSLRVAAGGCVAAVLLGMVALTAPVAAQPFTYGATEVHESPDNDLYADLSRFRTAGVTLCSTELNQINTDGDIDTPDPPGEVVVVETDDQGRTTETTTRTWTRGDGNTVAGECKFVTVAVSLVVDDPGSGESLVLQSGTLTITQSWVMPDLSAAASPVYTYVYADGGAAIAGNFTVPEGNCDYDESSDQLQIRPGDLDGTYGIKLNSRPDSTVWITVLRGTEAGDDPDLWSPSSTTWTISPTEYDAGQTTRWIGVCAYPDSDSANGTRSFHHLLNSNDKTFLGTTTLTVEEVDDD